MKALSTAALIVLPAMAAFASDAKERQVIAGAGASSCGTWIEGRGYKGNDLDNMLVSWVQGFLSGMNLQRYIDTEQDMVPIPNSSSLLAYIDKYCRENPLKDIAHGTLELYREISDT